MGAALVLLALGVFAVRWIAANRAGPPPRKVMQFTVVNVQPGQQPKQPLPQPPKPQPKIVEQVQTTRVNLKPSEFTPPDEARPAAAAPQGGGRLSLATEGQGTGDAFNLAGNPGGRGLLSGGGLGDGTGDGTGDGLGGASSAASRFGWYYARMAAELEQALRGLKRLTNAATRVELRVWADPDGRVTCIRLVRSTGDAKLDQAIESLAGLRLSEPPPRELPMPMVARLTARRPN